MTMKDACREMGFKKSESVKKYIPLGWIGAKGGLRIKTISFARQIAGLEMYQPE